MDNGSMKTATETPAPACGPSLWLRLKKPGGPALKKGLFSLLGLTGLVLLLLSLQGVFGGNKIIPGTIPAPAVPAGPGVAVVRREIDDLLEWSGTVRARTEAQVASKLFARIAEVRVEPGRSVRAGDVIVVLDDRDMVAKAEQAKAALGAAEAQAAQGEAEFRRVQGLFEKEAATRRDLEAAEARAKSVRAQVEQARQAVAEAEVFRSESVLRAPFDGIVSEKKAQPGDTAVPGRPVVLLYDPRHLRLEADVPEGCLRQAVPGMEVRVRIDPAGQETKALIEEIAPVADPGSRTVLIKIALPESSGFRPGQFGRVVLACGRKTVLMIPASAVGRSGQLEWVRVIEEGGLRVRHVRTGKTAGAEIEVLSGLKEGERIAPEGP